MFSKIKSLNNSTTASAPGKFSGKISITSDEGAVLTAVGDNGSGGGPVGETGNDCSEISSTSLQAI